MGKKPDIKIVSQDGFLEMMDGKYFQNNLRIELKDYNWLEKKYLDLKRNFINIENLI